MARKSAIQEEPKHLERVISFRAPDTVHGALKQIVGRLEIGQNKVDGRVPYERDILNWLIGELYMDGPDKWAKRITDAHRRFVDFANPN